MLVNSDCVQIFQLDHKQWFLLQGVILFCAQFPPNDTSDTFTHSVHNSHLMALILDRIAQILGEKRGIIGCQQRAWNWCFWDKFRLLHESVNLTWLLKQCLFPWPAPQNSATKSPFLGLESQEKKWEGAIVGEKKKILPPMTWGLSKLRPHDCGPPLQTPTWMQKVCQKNTFRQPVKWCGKCFALYAITLGTTEADLMTATTTEFKVSDP